MTNLQIKINQIVKDVVHRNKEKANLTTEQWKMLDIEKISEEVINKLLPLLEAWAYLPCCHLSGMHEPEHFANREYICMHQKAEAFERFMKDLGINPETKSKIDCGWCKDNPEERKGEGLRLFAEKESKK